ncbi:MAG: YdjY domain-containing protein [Planctomycetaceae bacterium]
MTYFHPFRKLMFPWLLVVVLTAFPPNVDQQTVAQEKPVSAPPLAPAPVPGAQEEKPSDESQEKPVPEALQKLLTSGVALNPEATVVLDRPGKRVLLKTKVACRECLLEMLCCMEQTKEHESIVSLAGRAETVHAGLLAIGLQPGKPVTFQPEFRPPSGPKVDIFANWVDAEGKLHRQDARSWMRTSVSHYYSSPLPQPPPGIKLPLMELRYDPYNKEILWYGAMSVEQRDKLLSLWQDATYQEAIRKFFKESQSKPMTADFVFAGSYQEVRPDTGEKYYAAQEGSLICVANFSSAMIDVAEVSSASDGGQAYEGWTERIPERGHWAVLELAARPK